MGLPKEQGTKSKRVKIRDNQQHLSVGISGMLREDVKGAEGRGVSVANLPGLY